MTATIADQQTHSDINQARRAQGTTIMARSTKNKPRKLSRKRYTPAAVAVYDALCDGGAQSNLDLVQVAATAALASDYNSCLEEGRKVKRGHVEGMLLRDIALVGAESFGRNALRAGETQRKLLKSANGLRMTAAFAREWKAVLEVETAPQPREPVTVQQFGEIAYYGGMSEWEGWAFAPLVPRDTAHFRLWHPLPVETLVEAFPGWEGSEEFDGLVSISAHEGAPVKQVVAEWLSHHGILSDGVRDKKGKKRRNLKDLPPHFLHDVVVKNLPLAQSIVSKRYQANMQVLVGDPAEIRSWIQMWVVELAQNFNAQLGRPFGTWVAGQIGYQVQNLNRKMNSRTASDLEIKWAKAEERFIIENDRLPEQWEMAEAMGMTEGQLHSKRAILSRLRSIRSAQTLESPSDAPDIPVVDDTDNPEREAIARENASRITMALVTAAGTVDPTTGIPHLERPIGFLMMIAMEWGDWVKSDLTHLAAKPASKVQKELSEIKAKLRADLADMSDRNIS